MSLQIEEVHDLSALGEASAIMCQSWPRPCLHFSREYLEWSLGFPSSLAPLLLFARENGERIGFVAAAGRRIQVGNQTMEVYQSSFLSVLAGEGRSTVSYQLNLTEGRWLRDQDRPFVLFAQADSPGEKMLAVLARAGLKQHPLGQYGIHSAMPRGETPRQAVLVSWREWGDAYASLKPAGDSLLDAALEPEQLRHFASDPWGRAFAVAADEAGGVAAAAMIARTEMLGRSGPQSVYSLHHIRARGEDPNPLRALVNLCATRPVGDCTEPVVILASVSHLAPDLLRAAGVRASASKFKAFSYSDGADPFPGCTGTLLEVT
ncbi:MAG: hypothetical protein K2X35_12340 [Bryobacteraceae bacterium]|nr:hypothetical protein [Bryobacteraceae bacterium]